MQVAGFLAGLAAGAAAGFALAEIDAAIVRRRPPASNSWPRFATQSNHLPRAVILTGVLLVWITMRATGWRGAAWGIALAFAAWIAHIASGMRGW